MKLTIMIEIFPVKMPVHIAGYAFDDIEVVTVIVEDGPYFGRGEASGVYYLGESACVMRNRIEAVRDALEAGVTRDQLRQLMPPCGARFAVDSALWEIEAQRHGVSVGQLAGVAELKPITTTYTVWAGSPDAMARDAHNHAAMPVLKVKLLGDGRDGERLMSIRNAAPEARICVDANQGLTRASYKDLLSVLTTACIDMLEQPFPIGNDDWLDGLERRIPIAVDEGLQGLVDIAGAATRYDMINIKLDKCGGLTEALLMIAAARARHLQVMVGCMMATSLSMAPAFIAAQLADFADIDGPLYLNADRPVPMHYEGACVTLPDGLWGLGSHPWHRRAEA
jgi:L-Ala-D/L-Glu epimerase